jgi:hypothetical protein
MCCPTRRSLLLSLVSFQCGKWAIRRASDTNFPGRHCFRCLHPILPTVAHQFSLTMYLAMLASCVGLLVGCYAAWSAITLEQNYRRALTMGIPLIRIPVDPLNIPWQVIEPHFWNLVDYLQISLPRNSVLLRRGWHFRVKAKLHEEMGTVWAFVTPRDIHLNVCDADALREIYARRSDFVRPREFYGMWMSGCVMEDP